MMTGWLLLASEAAESGFGLNSNILETNVINLAIIFGLIYYVGSGFLKKTLSERREAIVTELTESERRRTDAEAKLKQAQDQLADAKAEADRILAQAKASAQTSRDSIAAQAQADVARMKASAAQDLAADQERVVTELRQRAVNLALEKVANELPGRLDGGSQQRLMDNAIAALGGRS
jgi:F-type H+-transporting ATPase subunit b